MSGTGARWESLPVTGAVMMSALPAGLTAWTTHRGPYEEVDAAHQAVLRWCAAQHREITGERWEVYGDWHEDPAQLQTMVFDCVRRRGRSRSA
jgi:effector-binding domain-containing protein